MGAAIARVSRATAAKPPSAPSIAKKPRAAGASGPLDGARDPKLDSLLTQLDGSISHRSVKILDEETERQLAEAKRQRVENREAKLVGRLSTEEFRRLLQDPALSGGLSRGLSREAVMSVAEKHGLHEGVVWDVLSHTRVPPIVKNSDGYLVGKRWGVES